MLRGRGLHTGVGGTVRLHPSEPGGGPALWSRGVAVPLSPRLADPEARRCTALRLPAGRIATVEHLLAALAGLGAWDVTIECDGPEVPALDGSALPWAQAILASSVPCALRPSVGLRTAALWRSDGAVYRLYPGPALHAEVRHPLAAGARGTARAAWQGDAHSFVRDIAPARTFAFAEEVDGILAQGLARGADPACVTVLDHEGPILGTSLRFPDEPARHKLLDLIGDLALLGRPLAARVRARRPFHAANRDLCTWLERTTGTDGSDVPA